MNADYDRLRRLLEQLPEPERTEITEAVAAVVAGEIVAMVTDAEGVQDVAQKITTSRSRA